MDTIKISAIKITNRIRKEIVGIEELAASIQEFGLLNPITVMWDDGLMSYRLLAGFRRLSATKMLGWDEIDVRITSPADAREILRIEIIENEQREAFTHTEKLDFARLLQEFEELEGLEVIETTAMGIIATEERIEIKDDGEAVTPSLEVESLRPARRKGRKRDEIAKRIGMSGRQYDRLMYIGNSSKSDEILKRLDSGESSLYREYTKLREQELSEAMLERFGTTEFHPNVCIYTGWTIAEDFDYEHYEATKALETELKGLGFEELFPKKKMEMLKDLILQEKTKTVDAENELERMKEWHDYSSKRSHAENECLKKQISILTKALAEYGVDVDKLLHYDDNSHSEDGAIWTGFPSQPSQAATSTPNT